MAIKQCIKLLQTKLCPWIHSAMSHDLCIQTLLFTISTMDSACQLICAVRVRIKSDSRKGNSIEALMHSFHLGTNNGQKSIVREDCSVRLWSIFPRLFFLYHFLWHCLVPHRNICLSLTHISLIELYGTTFLLTKGKADTVTVLSFPKLTLG